MSDSIEIRNQVADQSSKKYTMGLMKNAVQEAKLKEQQEQIDQLMDLDTQLEQQKQLLDQ